MDRNKKIGTITMVLALLIAAAAVAFSTNPCHYQTPLTSVLLNCVRIDLPEYLSFGEYDGTHDHILTKYLLLLCAVIFAVGYLWLKGVLLVPGSAKVKAHSEAPDKVPSDA